MLRFFDRFVDRFFDPNKKAEQCVPFYVDNNSINFDITSNVIRSHSIQNCKTSGKCYFCNHDIKPLSSANQDRIDIRYLNNNKVFLGVYDGHCGLYVSENMQSDMYSYIEPLIIENESMISPKSLIEACQTFQDHLISKNSYKAYDEGAVATMMIRNNNILQFINVGDCRGIISIDGKAVQATVDHTCNNVNEVARLNAIEHHSRLKIRVDKKGIKRIGKLQPTRAFGDTQAYPYVDAIPEISFHELNGKEDFVVIASDGLWGMLSNQEVVNIVRSNSIDDCAEELCKIARKRGSIDDISVIVYFLK